jgi:hypothetical protein
MHNCRLRLLCINHALVTPDSHACPSCTHPTLAAVEIVTQLRLAMFIADINYGFTMDSRESHKSKRVARVVSVASQLGPMNSVDSALGLVQLCVSADVKQDRRARIKSGIS